VLGPFYIPGSPARANTPDEYVAVELLMHAADIYADLAQRVLLT